MGSCFINLFDLLINLDSSPLSLSATTDKHLSYMYHSDLYNA